MNSSLKNIKVNGHGYKKGRTWTLDQFLPRKKRLALQSLHHGSSRGDEPHPPGLSTPAAPEPVQPLEPVKPQPAQPAPAPSVGEPQSACNCIPAPPIQNPTPEAPNPANTRVEQAKTSNTQFQILDTQTRTGKIARLPHDIRELVNQMLRAGRRYSEIAAKLAELAHPGISINNLSTWKHGGYVDWLNQRHQLETRLALPKALERCTRSVEIDRVQQDAITLACDQLFTILGSFDATRAVALLYDRPQLLPSFISSLAALARATADLGKAFNMAQDREALVRKQLKLPATTPLAQNSNAQTPGSENDNCELPGMNLESSRLGSQQLQPILSNSR